MTITERTNDFDQNRPPLEFGIEWDRTNSDPVTCLSRLGDSVGMAVNTRDSPNISDFSRYYPWKGMQRYFLNDQGDVMGLVGESGGSRTEDANRVMVRVPFFFFKLELDTPTTDKWRYWISPYPLKGYRLHPAFLRWGYEESMGVLAESRLRTTDVFVGAYEAEITTAQKSIAGVAPVVNTSRAAFRSDFNSLGQSYRVLDWKMWNALQWLMLIEYGSLNSQVRSGTITRGGISAGITNGTAVEKTGWTSSIDVNEHGLHSIDLGDLSGRVQCNTNDRPPSMRCHIAESKTSMEISGRSSTE